MKYDFESIGDQLNVGSVKHHATLIKNFFKLNYYEDSISLWVSEMDFRMAPEIEEAIISRTQKGILGYSSMDRRYYENVINWMSYKHNTKVRKHWIVPSDGTVHAIRNVLRAFTSEGDKVIIQPPVYGQFAMQIEGTKRVVAPNELIKTVSGYQIDFAGFEELAKQDDVKLFILCNPHNPTGNIWKEDELKKLLSIAKENGVLVFSDEVHSEVVRTGTDFPSTIKFKDENVITAFGLGKTFNLTGMHMTNLIIPGREVRAQLEAYTGFSTASPITMTAVDAAYNESKEWLIEVNEVIDANLIFIKEFIDQNMPNVGYHIPEGTYLVWFDISAYGIETQKLTEMIADGRVLMEAGTAFGEAGEGHIRMMAATPRYRLEEALNRIKSVLDTIKG